MKMRIALCTTLLAIFGPVGLATQIEGPHHVFGGEEVALHLTDAAGDTGRPWHVRMEERVIARGRIHLRPGERTPIRFKVPETRAGVEIRLKFESPPEGSVHALHVHHRDTLALYRERLSGANVRAHDPSGEISAWLASRGLRVLPGVGLSGETPGLLLAGKMNPRQSRAFAESLPALLAKGHHVLWFAGSASPELDLETWLATARDVRFSAQAPPGKDTPRSLHQHSLPTRKFHVGNHRGRLVLRTDGDTPGRWDWAAFDVGAGRLWITGLELFDAETETAYADAFLHALFTRHLTPKPPGD